MIKTLFIIGFGGAIGSVARYLTSYLANKAINTQFPIATFTVNMLGSFFVGVVFTLLLKHNLQDTDYRSLLITGFAGGFTTFSAFTLENVQLIQSGNILLASAYILSSIIVSIIALYIGTQLV